MHPPQMAREQCRQSDFNVIRNKKSYHNFYLQITLNVATGIAPSELLMGCCLRTHLDALFPEISKKVVGRQAKQKEAYDTTKPLRGNLMLLICSLLQILEELVQDGYQEL